MNHGREIGLAATKLRAPVLPEQLVRRHRLGRMIDEALDTNVRLILASAAAGSGKTTLVAGRLFDRPEEVAWLQLEVSDSDPVRFWSYLMEAIGRIEPRIASEMNEVVVGSNADQHVVVPELVNKIGELVKPLVIVVDDYHLIDSELVHNGMEHLLELCPAQLTVVLLTRFDPPFRLGRMRVRKQIAEIRGVDLRFEPNEASNLLGAVGASLNSSQLDRICGSTEGWAAGLVLAGISLDRSEDPDAFIDAFHGDDQLVVDYLSDEFLGLIGNGDRQILLETSILNQMNGSLVDKVTGKKGGANWLRGTAKSNQLLFGLDNTGSWFRYHHLLRDLLRLEAAHELADRIPELHSRAAEWFESEGDLGQAISHQLAAGQRHEAARLMKEYGTGLLANGQVETLARVLEQLGDVARSVSWCALLYAWCEYIAGHYLVAGEWIEIALDRGPLVVVERVVAPLRMNIELGRGNVAAALEIARSAAPPDQLMSHTSDMATVAGGVYALSGQTDLARTAFSIAVEKALVEESRASHILALVYGSIATYEDGTPGEAYIAATLALDTADDIGLSSYYRLGPAYAIRARTSDDPAAARADALHAVNLARRTTGDIVLGYVLAICADTLIDLGDDAGKVMLADARSVIDRCTDPGIVGRHLVRVESRHRVAVSERSVDVLIEQLTEREMAVLQYLPTPMSQRDIAAELFVSLNTIKTHSSSIYRKLAVGDRKSAVQAARDHGLL